MQVTYANSFKKQYQKIPPKVQLQFEKRLQLFFEDATSPMLRVHPLSGRYYGYWSFHVTGDFRAIFQYQGDQIILFAFIGTHSQLY